MSARRILLLQYEFNPYYVASVLEHISPYCVVYLIWRQSCSWGRPECFQTTPMSILSPKLSNDGSYMDVLHQDLTLLLVFGTTFFTPTPGKFMFQIKRQRDVIDHRASRPAPRHQSVHRDSIHHRRGRVGAADLIEAHVSSNPGEFGHQDWSPRSIRHAKHAPCGRLCRSSSPDVRRVCLLCV